MEVQLQTVNAFAENTYHLSEGKDAVLIDPGFATASEFIPFQQWINENQLRLHAVLLTHAHIDHVIGINRVKSYFPELPVYLHPDDLPFWDNVQSSGAMFGVQIEPFAFQPNPLPEAGDIEFGALKLAIRFTPGHAPGHVVFYSEKDAILIAGDTVFQGSIGRTDLPMGNFETLERSIQTQIYSLPEQTVIYPGHGPSTTVAIEKSSNPFVRAI